MFSAESHKTITDYILGSTQSWKAIKRVSKNYTSNLPYLPPRNMNGEKAAHNAEDLLPIKIMMFFTPFFSTV